MKPEGITLSNISQPQKDKFCMLTFICGILKKKKKKVTLIKTERKVGCQQLAGGEKKKRLLKGYKLSSVR